MQASWVKIPFINLFVVTLLGAFLRLVFFYPVEGVNFKYFLHAHSHVALLGWLYSAFFVALLFVFLKEEQRRKRTFKIQFWSSQATILGTLIAFPIQGYAAVSITFSTLHILLSYWFIHNFLQHSKKNEELRTKHAFSFSFIKWSLFFMALSSLGPWAMAPIMASGNSGSPVYYLAIYFYLHFQYNGWFTFVALGLFFWWMETKGIYYNKKESKWFFIAMATSCMPAYALSTLWTQPHPWVYWVGGIAAAGQLFALYCLLKLLWKIKEDLKNRIRGISLILMMLVLTSLIIKLLLQFGSSFPLVADLAYKVRHFVIGYLHLTLIGFISFFVFVFFHLIGLISLNGFKSKIGMTLFIAGFIVSEGILFLQGTMYWQLLGTMPFYYQSLFAASSLMPIGMALNYNLYLGNRQDKLNMN